MTLRLIFQNPVTNHSIIVFLEEMVNHAVFMSSSHVAALTQVHVIDSVGLILTCNLPSVINMYT